MNGLYLPNGTFQPFQEETGPDWASLETELATRENAGSWLGFGSGILPDPDPILRKRGDDAQVLADLSADDQVTMAMLSRKYRVLNRQDYAFKPGEVHGRGVTAEANRLCERLTKDLENTTMRDIISGILDAPFFGLSVLEIMWEPHGNWWHIRAVEAKPYYWFSFDEQNRFVFRGETAFAIRTVPKGKFVLTRHFPTYENPYGLRLLSRCLWPVAFKRGGIQFYVKFLEKFGMPWTVATAPRGATRDEKFIMARDLAAMVQDAVMVVPFGSTVELQSGGEKAGNQHEAYLRRWDGAISKVLMGQTLTAEVGDKGTYAASKTHLEVSQEIAEADRNMVVTAMNELAWIYGQVNRSAELVPVFAYEEPKDLAAKADLDTKLHQIGVDFRPKHFEQEYGLSPDEFKLRETCESSPLGFSEPVPPAADARLAVIDRAMEEHLPEALAANKKFVSQLEKAIDRAESFEDLQFLLAELLEPETGPDEFENFMADIMTNAGLFGRFAAREEDDAGTDD